MFDDLLGEDKWEVEVSLEFMWVCSRCRNTIIVKGTETPDNWSKVGETPFCDKCSLLNMEGIRVKGIKINYLTMEMKYNVR